MGVSGAKRALHLARNLPAQGWQPIVLAGQPINERHDPTLDDCIPPQTIVDYGVNGRLRPLLKARAARKVGKGTPKTSGKRTRDIWGYLPWDKSFLSPFDRYLLDVPATFQAAAKLISTHRPEVMHISADPWSPLIVARLLHHRFKLPLVVDFRDPWSQHVGKMKLRPPPTRAALRRFELGLFRDSAKVILNTEACRDRYIEAYAGRLPADRFVAIRNAYDEGLFLPGAPQRSERFQVTYFGRFRKFVEPDALFEGFARFVAQEGPATLRIIGGLSDAHRATAEQFGIGESLEVLPPVPFRESLPVLQSADVLAMVINPASHLQIPGKLYDYLAAGRPILAVSANAEADGILAQTRAGLSAPHGDPAAIAEALTRLRHDAFAPDADAVEAHSARAQAARVAAVYNAIAR
jgi:glycosyltransferase involved in cell wall biosynthesis